MTSLKYAAVALMLAAAHAAPAAEPTFPTKPVRLIVTTSAGSGVDYFARVIAPALTELYRQQVIVENRPGAGGLIGASTIAAATPDGYTIGIASTAHVVAPLLQLKAPYRPLDDFTPIALLTSIPAVIVATGAINARSVSELVALAKAKPGQLNFASLGDGTAAHLQAEVFNRAAGVKVVHVPFKTVGDAHSAILGGEVQYLVFLVPSAMPLVKNAKARALAVTSRTRSVALPEVPSIVEAGLPAAESEVLVGVVGPARMPREVAARLHRDIAVALRKPETRERFASQGGTPAPEVTAEAYGGQLRNEYASYRKLIAELGLKAQ